MVLELERRRRKIDELQARLANQADTIRNERLCDAIEWCARQVWDGCDIDGGSFSDEMVDRGLLVEVPADEAFREEWGDEVKTMLTLSWFPPALAAGDEGGE
jgi:hypothetical protein